MKRTSNILKKGRPLFVVLIVAAHPGHWPFERIFITPLGNQIEVIIGGIQDVDAARVSRIRVIDVSFFILVKDANPRPMWL
jgi:hypothetical protein